LSSHAFYRLAAMRYHCSIVSRLPRVRGVGSQNPHGMADFMEQNQTLALGCARGNLAGPLEHEAAREESAGGAYMPLPGMCATRDSRMYGCDASAITESIISTIVPLAPSSAPATCLDAALLRHLGRRSYIGDGEDHDRRAGAFQDAPVGILDIDMVVCKFAG